MPSHHDISQSSVPLYIKLSLLCLNKTWVPKWLGYLCFIFSQLQILAVLTKNSYIALDDNTPSSSAIIHFFLKFFVLGDCLNSFGRIPLFVGTIIFSLFTIKMVSLLVYLRFSLVLQKKIHSAIQNYWGFLHTVHPLVIFFWIHTFSLGTIKKGNDENIHSLLIILAYFNIIANCIFALIFSIISVTYKTKDALSSKTNLLETQSVIFKILIPCFWVHGDHSQGLQIFMLVLALFGSILHDWIFIKYLPYYKINMLLTSVVFQAAQTSLALVSLIVKLIEVQGTTLGVFSVQMIWLLMLPLTIKAYHLLTWKVLLYIFDCDVRDEKNVAYLVHKRFIMLYFLKTRKIVHEGVKKLGYNDLMYQGRLPRIVMESGATLEELDRNKKLLVRHLKVICLKILSLYPKAFLAQINLACFYTKFEDLYLVSNSLIEEIISKELGYQAQISLNMIRFELQKKLTEQFSQRSSGQQGLNIENYIMNNELHKQMKDNMEKQAKIQHEFWKEFLLNRPNMMRLMKISLKTDLQKGVVKELFHKLLKIRPPSFLSPLIVYGMYSSLINNDLIEGEKYTEQSQEEAKRMRKFLKMNELNNHTAFSDETVKITMSGLKSKLGKIVDCSSNISLSYGWQASDMKGRHVTSLMPSFFRQRHDGFLNVHHNAGKAKILNHTVALPVKSPNGYIRSSWIHVKISPMVEDGIVYVALIKPIESNKRMLLVREDGLIEDMSYEFAKDMNLAAAATEAGLNISALCPEFKQVNDAFNFMANNAIGIVNSSPTLQTCKISRDEFFARRKRSSQFASAIMVMKRSKRDSQETAADSRSFFQGDTSRMTERPLLRINEYEMKNFEVGSDVTIKRGSLSNPNSEKENDAQMIYEDFLTGSNLVFYPSGGKKAIQYNVKVSNKIYDKDVIKFVMLEKIEQENVCTSSKLIDQEDDTIPAAEYNWRKVHPASITSISPEKFNEEIPNLEVCDEVQKGDFLARRRVSRNILGAKPSVSPRNNRLAEPEFKGRDRKKSITYYAQNQFLGSNGFKKMRSSTINDMRKSWFAQIEKPPKEEEEKLTFKAPSPKRLKQKLENIKRKAENSVTSSSYLKAKKVQQLVTQALKTDFKKKSASIFIYSLGGFLASMVILLALQTVNLYAGIHNMQSQIPVITTAFFRQNAILGSAASVRVWNGLLQGDYESADWLNENLMWKAYVQKDAGNLKKYNNELYECLNKISRKEQDRFYKRNVGIYEYHEDGARELIAWDSTFEAIQRMIEKEHACLNMEMPLSFTEDIDNSAFKFILDNILNDLLIQSQNQIDDIADDLHDLTGATNTNLWWILTGTAAVCLIVVLITVRYLYALASEAKFFMTTIFQLKPQDCEATQMIIQRFISALGVNMKGVDIDVEIKTKQGENQKSNSMKFRSASMDSLYNVQRLHFLKLLPSFILFICWAIGYFFLTSNFIDTIESYEAQMETALQAWNTQSLAVAEIISLPLTNGTAIVKNENFLPDFRHNLEIIKDTSVLVGKFFSKEGSLTSLQEKVLFGFPCEKLKEGSLALSCLNVAKGENSIGLVNVNSQFYSHGKYFLEVFESSPKTKEDLAELFAMGMGECKDLVDLTEAFLKILYESTHERFGEEVASVKQKAVVLTIMILIMSSLGSVVTWKFVIKEIFKMQNIDRFILKVVPIKLILNNKHLQRYLFKHFDGLLDGMKVI